MIFKIIKMKYKDSVFIYRKIDLDVFLVELDAFISWLNKGGLTENQSFKLMTKTKIYYKAEECLGDFLFNFYDSKREEEIPISNYCNN